MIKQFFNRFIQRRHQWRTIGFDELSELYISMMFRSLAMSIVGIFIPIYLYQHGNPVWQILIFYAIHFLAKLFSAPLVAYIIARIGPKHTILISYVFQVISMTGLVLLNTYDIPILAIAFVNGIGAALFFISFHVDFSKIKHTEHGGKEVGWMYSMQKIGAIIGPLIGGAVAFLFGSEYIFVSAVALFCLGALPLFFTKEPVQTHQKLDFSSLKAEDITRDLFSQAAVVLENSITIIVWPLFVCIFVFKDNPYIQLGSVASISVVVALFIARAIGSMIDNKKGRNLLHFGVVANAVLHLFRVFTAGLPSVLAVNVINEGVTIAYTMPYSKGMYDAADDHPGYRIVYITAMESVATLACVLFFSLAGIAAFYLETSKELFFAFFLIAAFASLAIATERYKALDPR